MDAWGQPQKAWDAVIQERTGGVMVGYSQPKPWGDSVDGIFMISPTGVALCDRLDLGDGFTSSVRKFPRTICDITNQDDTVLGCWDEPPNVPRIQRVYMREPFLDVMLAWVEGWGHYSLHVNGCLHSIHLGPSGIRRNRRDSLVLAGMHDDEKRIALNRKEGY